MKKKMIKPDGWTMGWPYRLTGETVPVSGRSYLEAVWLDGPRKGKQLLLPTPEQKAADNEREAKEYRERQEGFARLAKAYREMKRK